MMPYSNTLSRDTRRAEGYEAAAHLWDLELLQQRRLPAVHQPKVHAVGSVVGAATQAVRAAKKDGKLLFLYFSSNMLQCRIDSNAEPRHRDS